MKAQFTTSKGIPMFSNTMPLPIPGAILKGGW
jgi:hypothetical protein